MLSCQQEESMATQEMIENNFMGHPVSDSKKEALEEIRLKAKDFAHQIHVLVPDGREQSIATTKLEEAVFWANAGVARGV